MKIFLLFLSLTTFLFSAEIPLQKVSLQLQWLDQFQFAGYYMAKEKGFYKQKGLDVELRKFQYSTDVVDEVLNKRATFGVGRSSLIQLNSEGKKVVLLSSIFQSSPFILISLKSSNIQTVDDFKNKTLMLTEDAVITASIHAIMKSYNINNADFKFKKHTFDLEELIDGRVDLYAGYISNEPFILKQRGVEYKIISPKDEGFDFYSDLLFTSEYELKRDPKSVKNFKKASLEGWRYAFENIDEAVELIYTKYNPQNKTKEALYFEAKELKKLAYVKNIKLGTIDKDKVSRIFDVYKLLGLTKGNIDLDSLVYESEGDIVSMIYKQIIEFKYVKESFIFLMLLVMSFLYRQYLLKGKNEELEKLQDELLELNHTLESKVVKANDDLQRAQEMTKVGSWVLDIPKNDLRWSLQTFKIFDVDINNHGYLYEEFLDRVHPEDRAMLEGVYFKSLDDKKSYKLEHRLLLDDGSVKYVLENCETSFDKDGEPLVSYGTIQDITESTEQKMEIKAKERQLLHQSRLAQMGEMLSMIAHQWKQPLGSISASQISMLMAIELGQYDLDDKQEREEFLEFNKLKLNKIAKYVHNLSQVISDFSDFYRPNKKSQEVVFDDVILKSKTLFIDMLKSSKVKVKLNLDTNCEVYIHENELMQVILNIVSNARDQLVENSIKDAKIEIRTYRNKNDVFVEISDNAGGIDKDIINKIFDPYFSTKLEKNGTGLGLYMSRSIVEDYHAGSIDVFNIQDGAMFRLRISRERRKVDRYE